LKRSKGEMASNVSGPFLWDSQIYVMLWCPLHNNGSSYDRNV